MAPILPCCEIPHVIYLIQWHSKSIHIPLSPSTKMSLGYCFVGLMHPSDSVRAINELSGKTLFDRKVSVRSIRTMDVAEYLLSSNSPKSEQGSQIVPQTPGNSEVKLDSNKTAQTETARQKMEELRAQEIHTKDENRQAMTLNQETPPVSNVPQTSIVETGAPVGPLMHGTENQTSNLPSMSNSKLATFNIPGLFMEPNAQEVITLDNRTDDFNTSITSQVDRQPLVDIAKSTQASITKMLKESPPVSLASDVAKQQTATLMHRKRHKAADFIDSPSVRIRRSLGQAEDTSVIIEVSEDEENENSGDDMDMDIDIEEDGRPTTPEQRLPNAHLESGKSKSIKDQPPLSDVPMRKPVTPRILGRTPPKVLTPKKSKEPQGLEIEIELMDRKIAEMQQRILAKQNASRAQTPDRLGSLGKVVGISTTTHVHIKPSMSSMEEASMAKAQTDLQKSEDNTNAAEVATVAQATLVAEKVAEAAQAVEQERILTEQHTRALEQARLDAERLRVAEAEKIAEEERRRLRRTEIEAGIPVLDAEMERATQKLLSLKRQIEELEIEVQKGIEGRCALLEELTGLSSSIPIVNMPQNDSDGSAVGLNMRAEDVRRGKYSVFHPKQDLRLPLQFGEIGGIS